MNDKKKEFRVSKKNRSSNFDVMKNKNFQFEFKDSYFKLRNLNDQKRLKSFDLEKKFLNKYINFKGKICDVGCSTGEFLNFLEWQGQTYGMEINKYALEKAKKSGFKFDKNILNKTNFFDVVVFRGTVQHIEQPFYYLRHAYKALKKGGYLFILQTPNIDSYHYRLFKDLPALDKNANFYLPGFKNIVQICKIFNFKHCGTNFPYLNSGYENLFLDFICFVLKIFKIHRKNTSFPGNMMNLAFKK